MWFEAISGLKVNLQKSEIIPVGECRNGEALANLMGVQKRIITNNVFGVTFGCKI